MVLFHYLQDMNTPGSLARSPLTGLASAHPQWPLEHEGHCGGRELKTWLEEQNDTIKNYVPSYSV
jgi:hypothetical protein